MVIGLFFQGIMMLLLVPWYHPQTILLVAIFAGSLVYMAPENTGRRVGALVSLVSSPTLVMDLVQSLNEEHLRCLLYAALLFPTILETRTVGFLSTVIVEAGWVYNCLTVMVACAVSYYRKRLHNTSPRDDCASITLVLYGSALFTSVYHLHLSRIPFLAGPFGVATGVLLMYRDESDWLSGAVRQALRLSLRDVLARLGTNVHEDEMLRLAMLRWIVEYWSYRRDGNEHNDDTFGAATGVSLTTTTATATTTNDASISSGQDQNDNVNDNRNVNSGNTDDIQWDDLLPMLTATTEQMEQEVSSSSTPETSDTTQPSSSSSVPSETPEQGTTAHNQSLENLKAMLTQMSVDEHARPAVQAYKTAVAKFPPTRTMALVVAISRRCPASLLLGWHLLTASGILFPCAICCLPLVLAEVNRVLQWAESCETDGHTENDSTVVPSQDSKGLLKRPLVPLAMDPVWILLTDDVCSAENPPTLLQVWFNVQSSAAALETGLSAARCVQTTAVAVDFCSNLASLAHLGVQVSQQGWQHGLAVMAGELVQMHVHQQQHNELRYTSAALNALRNGQIVAENVQKLIEDKEVHPTVVPVLNVVTTLVGRGWLWGKEEDGQDLPATPPTVVIEEIDPNDTPEESNDRVTANADTEPSQDKDEEPTLLPTESVVVAAAAANDKEKKAEIQDKNVVVEETIPVDEPTLDPVNDKDRQVQDMATTPAETSVPAKPKEQDDVEPDVLPSLGDAVQDDPGSKSWDANVHQQPILVTDDGFPDPSTQTVQMGLSPSTASSQEQRPQQDHQPRQETAGDESQDGEHDWTKWVGGGLAVLGAAVVGGVALAHSAQQNETPTANRTSTVVIEELTESNNYGQHDDDDDEDDWVAITNTNH